MSATGAPGEQGGASSGSLIYVRPAFGGIYDYSESILELLKSRRRGASIEVVSAPSGRIPWVAGRRLAQEILSRPGSVLAELGGGDASMLWALRRVVRERPVVVTIHDPGVVVGSVFGIWALQAGPRALARSEQLFNGALQRARGRALIRDTLGRARARIVLNPALDEVAGTKVVYLPQPVYAEAPAPHPRAIPPKIAFLGFWGPAKGLDELLEAYRQLIPRYPAARFVIAGGGVSAGDPYEQSVRARAGRMSPAIELPGFIPPEEMTAFLQSLSALVLPYHPELPGGASAMLLRAQEAGVPLVLSDTPLLRPQVDPQNVTLVPARNSLALTDAIAGVLERPDLHEEQAAREQARVHREHGRERVGRVLETLLGESLGWPA